MAKRPRVHDAAQNEFIKLVDQVSHRHRRSEIFRDFCEMAAIAISNSVDLQSRETREARYMQIVKRYEPKEVAVFPQLMSQVVLALEDHMHDFLGAVFMAMELGNEWRGQFFTPYEVCHMMAKMTILDVADLIKERGFFSINEPCCGAGAMMIATAQHLKDEGHNYQQVMHVTAVDLDSTAVHMAYLQFSLLHIPAVITHGDALWPKPEDQVWYTPAHILGLWSAKLKRARAEKEALALLIAPEQPNTETPVQLPASAAVPTEQLTLFA